MPRLLASLVGIPILLGAIWWGPPWLTLLVMLAAVLGVREFYRLAPLSSSVDAPLGTEGKAKLPVALGALWVVALVFSGQAASSPSSLLLISLGVFLGGAFVALLWLIAFYFGRKPMMAGAYLIGGPVYVGLPLAHALALRGLGGASSLGRDWLLFALLVTFATDTGAFFVGRSVGRRRMAPQISPNKTWEGAAGGFILAVVAGLILGHLLDLAAPLWQQGVTGAAVGVAAQLGDLFESKLKRLSHAKEAGSIIPGHGGILDRLDSIVASVPVVYYLVAVGFNP